MNTYEENHTDNLSKKLQYHTHIWFNANVYYKNHVKVVSIKSIQLLL